MILFWRDSGRRLCEALEWSLYSVTGDRVYVPSQEALVGHLRAHPDVDFNLRRFRLREDTDPHVEIDDPKAADYGPESGHIFCGTVRYDTTAGRVVSK
jgi:hypothetical protein